jgi:hypothetical protein
MGSFFTAKFRHTLNRILTCECIKITLQKQYVDLPASDLKLKRLRSANFRILSAIFLFAYFAVVHSFQALAKGGPCAGDIERFCSGLQQRGSDFQKCIYAHRGEFTESCQKFLAQKLDVSKDLELTTGIASRKIQFIDTHVHLDRKVRKGESDFSGAVSKAIKRMDALGIAVSLVMPPPMPPNHSFPYDYEKFAAAINKYPGRFAFLGGGGSLNPLIQEALAAKSISPFLRKKFETRARKIIADGAVGFGEMNAEHFSFNSRHPYENAPADHPLFLLLADIAAELDVPIDLHMEAVEKENTRLPNQFERPTNPDRVGRNIPAFERLLAHNRKARIIWAHAGWDNTGQRTAQLTRALLKRNSNLFLSLKIYKLGPTNNRPFVDGKLNPDWMKLLNDFPDRFIVGTDAYYPSAKFQLRRPTFDNEIRTFLNLLPAGLAHQIAVTNAQRIYRLPFSHCDVCTL